MYAGALLISAPASWLDQPLARASAGQLRLVQAQGTLWSGSGELEMRDESGLRAVGLPASWSLQAGTLLDGKLDFEVMGAGLPTPFMLSLDSSGVDIAGIDVRMPAAALASVDGGLSALGLAGEVQLKIARLSFGRGGVHGSALLHWRDATSAASPLGEYQLQLVGDGPSIQARLHTLQGPVRMEGGGRWAAGRQADIRVTVRVPAHLQPRLQPLLRLVAVERADGSFALNGPHRGRNR